MFFYEPQHARAKSCFQRYVKTSTNTFISNFQNLEIFLLCVMNMLGFVLPPQPTVLLKNHWVFNAEDEKF